MSHQALGIRWIFKQVHDQPEDSFSHEEAHMFYKLSDTE